LDFILFRQQTFQQGFIEHVSWMCSLISKKEYGFT